MCDPAVLAAASLVIGAIRKAKSEAKVSMRTELTRVEVSGPAAALELAQRAAEDLRAAGKVVGELRFTPGDAEEISVAAEVAAPAES